jgi:hypothetical protein
LIPLVFKNSWNSADVYCGPLSVTTCAGTPSWAKMVQSRSMSASMWWMALFPLQATSSVNLQW